jgi:hypothetical protein
LICYLIGMDGIEQIKEDPRKGRIASQTLVGVLVALQRNRR